MQNKHWQLLTLLSDGISYHVQDLARELAVAPQQLNAIWHRVPNHVRDLLRQQDGTWHLARPLALVSQAKLAQALNGFTVDVFDECVSSNDEVLLRAKEHCNKAHRYLCVAHSQSAGRGRQGKTWYSREGECLMFSLGWVFDKAQTELSALTLVVAIACHRALARLGLNIQIKWPNDLVVGVDKLGGILIETMRSDGKTVAVIGIGLNFAIPKEVEQATSLQSLAEHSLTAHQVLTELITELEHTLIQFEQIGFAHFLADYENANRDQGQIVRLSHNDSTMMVGEMLGVTEQGALRLKTQEGERCFVSGEISLRPLDMPVTPTINHRWLLLDAGNSQLKWAWVENGVFKRVARAQYRDLAALAREWQERDGQYQIAGCAVCGEEKKNKIAEILPFPIQWHTSQAQAMGIRNHYHNPAEHGSDRWFNILGSRQFSQKACVIVSCGTAVTVDALTHDNQYLGGTIMPGFHLMRESLILKTANLNRPVGKVYPFPTTTSNAIASGIMDAVCGSVFLMYCRLKEKLFNQEVEILLTGGGAQRVAEALNTLDGLDNRVKIIDNLVLYGLLSWVEKE